MATGSFAGDALGSVDERVRGVAKGEGGGIGIGVLHWLTFCYHFRLRSLRPLAIMIAKDKQECYQLMPRHCPGTPKLIAIFSPVIVSGLCHRFSA
ncbi:hypothetical protein D3C85_1555770 [compost metagenome]